MGAEADFSNAFAADGIIPPQYGLRTVVEYRAQLLTVPKPDFPALFSNAGHQPMDMVTPTRPSPPSDPGLAPRSENGYLQPPDPTEIESAVRNVEKQVDVGGLSALDSKYLAILRVDRPMFLGGKVRPLNLRAETPRSPILERLNSWFHASARFREPHPNLLSWHWGEDWLAVVTGAHMDRICAYNFEMGRWETSAERVPLMNGSRCVSFRPFAGRVLAIGCEIGVALFGNGVRFLEAKGHTHVVSLDWSADGSKLATVSAADGAVRLWDVGTGRSMFVDRGNVVRFSRGEGKRFLFVANPTANYFRLWCCETWKSERWGYLSGPVSAVTWSPDGMTLLFSTEGESAIHVICIGGPSVDDETRVVHTELTGLPREGPGGTPALLEMDATGERLAVVYQTPSEDLGEPDLHEFNSDPHRRFAVALFATQSHPNFRISPIGYISGPENCGPPVAVKFKPQHFTNRPSVLACMWRNGDITFTQLLFTPRRH